MGLSSQSMTTYKHTDLLSERVAACAPELSPALKRVIVYLDANRSETLAKSAMELAAQLGTSDATIVRAAQALGFDGLKELKRAIAPIYLLRKSAILSRNLLLSQMKLCASE